MISRAALAYFSVWVVALAPQCNCQDFIDFWGPSHEKPSDWSCPTDTTFKGQYSDIMRYRSVGQLIEVRPGREGGR